MLAAMHGVLQQVEQQEGRRKAQPQIGDRPGRQSHAECGLELRPEGVRRREGKGGEDDIEEPDADIAEPPPQRRKLPPPPRPAEFYQGDGEQAADNDAESYQRRLPLPVVALNPTPLRRRRAAEPAEPSAAPDPGQYHIPAGQTIDGLPFARGCGLSGADSSVSPSVAIA